jgi:hypothetical protein
MREKSLRDVAWPLSFRKIVTCCASVRWQSSSFSSHEGIYVMLYGTDKRNLPLSICLPNPGHPLSLVLNYINSTGIDDACF